MIIAYLILYVISVAVLIGYWVGEFKKLTLCDVIEAVLLSIVLVGILYFIILGAEDVRSWIKKRGFKDYVIWQEKEDK